MNYRDHVLLPSKAITAAGTETISVKSMDPFSELVLIFRYTNNGNTPTEHPTKCIKKVQLVDGSEMIVDLTGYEAQALDFYHNQRVPLNVISFIDDNIGTVMIRIPFGRWLWDANLAFDPSRFNNPQLIVEHDLTLGGSAPDAATLEIILRMFDGKKINPIGYLRSRRHYTYSLVSSGVETIDIPVDLPIKMMIVQSIARTKAVNAQFSNLKLSEDGDKKIPLDNGIADLIKILQEDTPPYIEDVQGNIAVAGAAYYVTPCYEEYAVMTNLADSAAVLSAAYLGGGKATLKTSVAVQAVARFFGWCPHGALAVRFGDPWDIDDWYNLGSGHSLKAMVTGGSAVLASSTGQIVLQQLKKY